MSQQSFGARHGGINQVAMQQFKVMRRNGEHHRRKFTPSRFVYADGPRKSEVIEVVFFVTYAAHVIGDRSEEHTSELQSRGHLVCRLLLEKKKIMWYIITKIHGN